MRLIIYQADVVGKKNNCMYPHRREVGSADELSTVVAMDHVCAEYENNYRSIANFKKSNCVVMDCDNDHTDDPAEWITPESLASEYEGIKYAITFSRHHMKEKEGKSARPRFHIYFEIEPTADASKYTKLKKGIHVVYPFYDDNALDAGRFIYGSSTDEVIWHDGDKTIEYLVNVSDTIQTIPEGRRNATMSRFAGRIVKRYGVTEQSYKIFLEEAEKCDPPLDDEELSKIWASARRFAKRVQSQPGYVPPEQFKSSGNLKPSDYSDIGQAKMVATDCATELAYSTGTDFIVYDGKRWVESKPKSIGCMERFLDRQLADAKAALAQAKEKLEAGGISEQLITSGGKALEKQIQPDQMQAYLAFLSAVAYHTFVMKRRDIKFITSALQAVKPLVEVETSELDVDENLLNCPDGTYDLRLGMEGRREHDPDDLITKIMSYAPGDEGKELWLAAVDKTFQGDAELAEYVQKIVGLAAIGEVYQEAIIIAFGDGSNGKSTFWNTIAGAMGNYAGMISADALTVGCRRNVKPELAEVKGKRILIAAELEEGMRLSTSIVKQLSSTDEIEGEKKYKDPFKFRPTHTLVLYTNHLPKVGAMDTGIWRRLIVIPFDAKITGKSDIKNYSKYLLTNAGPYITKWIIEGAQKAITDNYKLKVPKCVKDAIERYKSDNDWMTHFLEECCEVGDGLEEKSGELYSSYRSFCGRSGEFCRSTTEFYSMLKQRGFERVRRNSGRFVLGLQLSDTEADF